MRTGRGYVGAVLGVFFVLAVVILTLAYGDVTRTTPGETPIEKQLREQREAARVRQEAAQIKCPPRSFDLDA